MRQWKIAGLLAALLTLSVSGCGGGHSSTTLTGTVTYEGEPVQQGSITFFPTDGKGTPTYGKISDGKYVAENVPPGVKSVQITGGGAMAAPVTSSEEMMRKSPEAQKKVQGVENQIPPDAVIDNPQVEVKMGKQEFNFQLTKPRR